MDDQAPEAIDPMERAMSLIANSEEESDPPEEEEQDAPTEEEGEESEDAETEEEGATEAPKEVVFAGQKFDLPANTPPELVEQIAEVGKQLQGDYTRKTQELASREKQAAEFFQKELDASKQHVQVAIAQMEGAIREIGGFLDPVQMEMLKDEDRQQWAFRHRLQAGFEQGLRHLQALNEKDEQVKAQRIEAAKQEAWQRLNAEGIDRDALQKLWAGARQAYPFITDDRLNQALDAETWLVLRDAVAYRQLKAQKPVIAKKVADAPQLPKAKQPMPKEVRERLDARKAVAKKGGASMRDLASFIASNSR